MNFIIAVTADKSRWVLDPEYVEILWQEYCGDALTVLDACDFEDQQDGFLDFLLEEHYDAGIEDWLFANALLLSPGTEVHILFDTGDLPPTRKELDAWIAEPEFVEDAEWSPSDQAYAQGWKRPAFEVATPNDLNRISEGGYFQERE